MQHEKFTVIAIDGDFIDFDDPGTNFLRFDALSWADACEIVRLSFMQGFQCVCWMIEREDAENGGE